MGFFQRFLVLKPHYTILYICLKTSFDFKREAGERTIVLLICFHSIMGELI